MDKVVIDLSGAFRLENKEYYEKYYGFYGNRISTSLKVTNAVVTHVTVYYG